MRAGHASLLIRRVVLKQKRQRMQLDTMPPSPFRPPCLRVPACTCAAPTIPARSPATPTNHRSRTSYSICQGSREIRDIISRASLICAPPRNPSPDEISFVTASRAPSFSNSCIIYGPTTGETSTFLFITTLRRGYVSTRVSRGSRTPRFTEIRHA